MDRDSYPRAAKAAEREPGGFDARACYVARLGSTGLSFTP